MLDSIREYLPISGMEWDLVAQRHMAFHPDKERSGDQLKKKFNKLSKVKMGTGDPNMPPDVREAKDICRLIIEKYGANNDSEVENSDDSHEWIKISLLFYSENDKLLFHLN